MFTCRFLARLSRNQATLASLGCLTIPQRLASHRILPSSPMAITNALIPCTSVNANRRFASNEIETETTSSSLDSATYERVCSETLDALCDYFEELTENAADLQGSDVAYSDGVLTVNLGHSHGTYVINRQTPNKQIWLSSPTSGPKRYDFVGGEGGAGKWVYKHSGQSLHELLQQEIPNILRQQPVDFLHLPYCS
ncbi:frataxin homolog, mitochondrial [Drosophila kikkawai]|uniref:ferroxidase n=1 Tax=Drosophila kikkawai TaxID=30033 RepID=A0A6P4JIN7_DROKI|nr:frataxin homolog, mitochondrial [Drosophila kikkawai]